MIFFIVLGMIVLFPAIDLSAGKSIHRLQVRRRRRGKSVNTENSNYRNSKLRDVSKYKNEEMRISG